MLEHFWKNVQKLESGCWEWTKSCYSAGYGCACIGGGKHQGAHRVSWCAHYGAIPAGMMVLHKCDNRRCVNPEHLFLGTAADNAKDMVRKGRQARGCTHGLHVHPERVARGSRLPQTRMTDEMLQELFTLKKAGAPTAALAAHFTISPSHVRRIVARARTI